MVPISKRFHRSKQKASSKIPSPQILIKHKHSGILFLIEDKRQNNWLDQQIAVLLFFQLGYENWAGNKMQAGTYALT